MRLFLFRSPLRFGRARKAPDNQMMRGNPGLREAVKILKSDLQEVKGKICQGHPVE